MPIAGNLAEFALADIFRFLETQQGTGLLSIHPAASNVAHNQKAHYLWLVQGRIVAAACTLDGKGLIGLISQRGWVSHEEIYQVFKLRHQAGNIPTGLLLKTKGVLQAEQLKLLFHIQVLRPLCSLLRLQEGKFVFDSMATLPKEEMTGLSISATEAILWGLRLRRDWKSLADKLPHPTKALVMRGWVKPELKLDYRERQVWQLADGKVSIEAIAHQLDFSLEIVQQIAFRLQKIGLVEEVAIVPPSTAMRSAETRAARSLRSRFSFNSPLVAAAIHVGMGRDRRVIT
ncbi:DUF4388 domain-containing protein [Microcoleus sp. FACHB-831]|uniref:DUF4388 domain-containing protein n=1 Tax=Microcoleus sp. FACHB-831 TaxID=2692827 RepID=UPI0016861817|nr:DUF4388 domain-containing protein [Microcoleus sp. FACHB-831]MBD1920441.1 DUF4388 domain-containing protein [Microcoleus sp. FACHB-831]